MGRWPRFSGVACAIRLVREMVAIVAGNGLGLFNALLNSLGGAVGQGSLGQLGGQVLVNAHNGNLILQFTDEQLSGLWRDLLHLRTSTPRVR